MKTKITERGFGRADFTDHNGKSCSIQDSSLATESAVWLGVDDVVPMVRGAHGWEPMPLPEGALVAGRMHLTQDQAKDLLPLLRRFVETGSIDG